MGLTRSLLVILLLCLVYPHSRAFILRSGVSSEDNVNKLAEALRLIERERRRISDEEPVNHLEEDVYWNSESDDLSNQNINDLLNRLLSNDEYDVDSIKVSLPNNAESDLEAPETTAVNKDELQTIFNPLTEEEEEHDNAVQTGREENMTLDDTPEVKRDSSSQSDVSTNTQLSDEQVATLLKAADDAEINDMMKSDDEGDNVETTLTTNEPVSKEEVSSILQDSNHSENDDVETGESDWLVPEPEVDPHGFLPTEDWPGYNANANINKEWLLTEYLKDQPDTKVSRKSKRSENLADVQDETTQDTRADQIEALIGKFIEYEDNQNQNLIRALDLATRAQTEKSDNFIPEEINYIRKAIEDEEIIHQLKKLLRRESELTGGETDNSDDTDSFLKEKRGEPIEEEVEDMDDSPDDNQVDDNQVDIPDNIDPDVAARIRQYVMGQQAINEEDNYAPDRSEDEWYTKPVSNEGLTETDIYMNPFLRKLIQRFRDEQLRRRVMELKNRVEEEELSPLQDRMLEQYLPDDIDLEERAADEITREETDFDDLPEDELNGDTDECVAVEDLVDNCAFTKREGLGIDDEARDLCNRHQLCYICGAELGMTAASCNQGYLTEADTLCADDEMCKNDAAALFILMMDHHVFIPRGLTNPVCGVQCAEDLIVGDLDKK